MKNLQTMTYEPVEIAIKFIKIEKGFAQTTIPGTTGEGYKDNGVF